MNTLTKFFFSLISTFLLASLCTIEASVAKLRQDSIKTGFVSSRFRTTFYVYAPASQNYSIKFWAMGVYSSNGGSSTYDYGVDGVIKGTIHPTKFDWCVCTPNNPTIYLTEGTHEIYLENYNELPNAELVYSYSSPSFNPSYDNYYNRMKGHIPSNMFPAYESPLERNYQQLSYHPVELDSLIAPIHYTAEWNKEVYYTFYRLDYYLQGQYVNIYTYADDSLKRIVHVFNQDASFSVTSPLMDTDCDYYSCTIPQDGFYYVLVRSYNPNEWGTCDITINNRSFEDVPVNCSYTAIESPAVGKEYACFAISKNADPMVFLMSPGNNGGIVKFNDEFRSTLSNFDWGKNARVDGPLSTGQWLFTLTKSLCSSQIMTKCDIYTRCEKRNLGDLAFPDYKIDDFLYSAPNESYVYNCISWAVGDWVYGYWFPENIPFTTENWNSYVDSVFNAYGLYPTTESEATVDLWALEDGDGNVEYTHASVKSKGHRFAAGYSWESKMADLYRSFHPRYALRNMDFWGDVIRHYGKGNHPDTIPGVIIPHLAIFNLEQDEFNQIEQGVLNVRRETDSHFERLYDDCRERGSLKVTIFIDSYEKVDVYKQLLDYCKEHLDLRYLLYKKICEGDILAIKLLKDLTLAGENAYLWKEVRDDVQKVCNERIDAKCLYNAQSFGMLLVKKLLAAEGVVPKRSFKASYSDSPFLQVVNNNRHLQLLFDLESDAIVSIHIGNVEGTYIRQVVNKQRMDKGNHSYQYRVPKAGLYVVGLTVNGAVYKKTLQVE